jgi:predicted RNA-binding Zn ribbon-like protein
MVREDSRFLWVGNHPALDFLNTLPVIRGAPTELLETAADLVDWLREGDLLPVARARDALTLVERPRDAERVAARARAFREVLRGGIENVVHDRRLGEPPLAAVNEILGSARGTAEVVRTRGGFERRRHVELREPADLLVPLGEVAADLLCHADLGRVRRCENPECVLYFYDVSKNQARRWCSMALCGNRRKAAAHYRRERERRRGEKAG